MCECWTSIFAGVWESPEHHQAAERDQGEQRQGHLPGVREHGHGPAQRDQARQHPEGHPQALHHLPAAEGHQVHALRQRHPQGPEALQRPPQRRVLRQGQHHTVPSIIRGHRS